MVGHALNFIRICLTSRKPSKQKPVETNGTQSTYQTIDITVPQGTTLGPILINLYKKKWREVFIRELPSRFHQIRPAEVKRHGDIKPFIFKDLKTTDNVLLLRGQKKVHLKCCTSFLQSYFTRRETFHSKNRRSYSIYCSFETSIRHKPLMAVENRDLGVKKAMKKKIKNREIFHKKKG